MKFGVTDEYVENGYYMALDDERKPAVKVSNSHCIKRQATLKQRLFGLVFDVIGFVMLLGFFKLVIWLIFND